MSIINAKKIFASQEASNIHIASSDENSFEDKTSKDEGRLALDIFDTEENLFIVAPLAGVSEKDVEIAISEDVLTIQGSRKFPDKLPEAREFFAQECFWGEFSRSIVLPSAVNSADIKAKMKQNVLVIAVPKAKKAKNKVIPIEIS